VLPGYAWDNGKVPKAAIARFGINLFPFPVKLGPTRAYNSAMGGNASTGWGALTTVVYEI